MSTGLLLGFALALGAAVLAAAVALLAVRRLRARCLFLESSLAALRREVEVVASLSARTGRRVQQVEEDYSGVAGRVERVESRGATGAPAEALDHAIEMARHGVDSNKLAEQFGLSPGEAELVARLHGQKKRA